MKYASTSLNVEGHYDETVVSVWNFDVSYEIPVKCCHWSGIIHSFSSLLKVLVQYFRRIVLETPRKKIAVHQYQLMRPWILCWSIDINVEIANCWGCWFWILTWIFSTFLFIWSLIHLLCILQIWISCGLKSLQRHFHCHPSSSDQIAPYDFLGNDLLWIWLSCLLILSQGPSSLPSSLIHRTMKFTHLQQNSRYNVLRVGLRSIRCWTRIPYQFLQGCILSLKSRVASVNGWGS